MDKKIDIIVTYVNPSLPAWQEEFLEWKQKERTSGHFLGTEQATGECRFRNWDTLKFWFRGVERNLTWINNIFLVIEDESHIPEWLNTSHPQLKIVYHRDYIPNELLPTFNSNTIEMFFYRIEELEDLYLLSNDDMFFANPVPKEYFYKNGYIIKDKAMALYRQGKNEFERTLDNNHRLLVQNKKINNRYQYIPSHLVEIHQKSLEKKFVELNYKTIYAGLAFSHFRYITNHTNWMFNDLLKSLSNTRNSSLVYKHSYFTNLVSDGHFDTKKAAHAEMLCLNDTPKTNFEKAQPYMYSFLESIFPFKSSFEK